MLSKTVLSEKKISTKSLFEEQPVDLTAFITSRDFMHNPRLSDEQYWAVRYAEQIYRPDLYAQMVEDFGSQWAPLRSVNFLTLEWGKGSGKDHVARILSLRIAYLLQCLRSPLEYYNLPVQDTIHLLNVASSAPQALNAFFKPMTEVVKTGWFKGRCKTTVNKIVWDKHIESLSGHSDTETQEGLNIILGVADEVDAFPSAEEARLRGQREPSNTVESILDMLQTSGQSRFFDTFKCVRISYPRYAESMITTLRKSAQADAEKYGMNSRHYASGPKFTWEVNPRYAGQVMVPVPCCEELVPKSLEEDFLKNPEMALAKYMCRPARSQSPYFRDEDLIDAARTHKNPISVSYARKKNQYGQEVWDPIYDLGSFRPIAGARYAMHADLAQSGDRAGIAMAHVVRWTEHDLIGEDEEGGRVEHQEIRPEVKVDFAITYEADMSEIPVREIQVRWGRQLCFALRERGFPIFRFTFDGWQSLDSIQILEAAGIESKRVSTDINESAWQTLRDVIYEGRGTMPDEELLRHELLSLTRLNNGKIDHPPKGSKDLADAVACAVLGAIEERGVEAADGEILYPHSAEFETFVIGAGFEGLTIDTVSWSPDSFLKEKSEDGGWVTHG